MTTGAPAGAQTAAWVSTLPVRPYGPYYVSAFVEGQAYVVQQADTGDDVRMFKSTDFGMTWSPVTTPTAGRIMADFLTADKGIALIENRLFRTTDGARTWSRLRVPWHLPATVEFLDAGSDGKSIVAGVQEWRELDGHLFRNERGSCHDPRRDRLTIFGSADGGETWRSHEVIDAPIQADAADFADARHGAIAVSDPIEWEHSGACFFRADVTIGQRVLVTTKKGNRFRTALECPQGDSCLAVDRSSRRHLVVGTTSGAIATSFDGGRTFEDTRLEGTAEIPGIYDDYRWVYDIAFADDEVGYAMTNGRGMWRTTDGGRTWTREPSPYDVPGEQRPGLGRLAVAGPDHAIAVGPSSVVTRVP
jgi:hypothetical protein